MVLKVPVLLADADAMLANHDSFLGRNRGCVNLLARRGAPMNMDGLVPWTSDWLWSLPLCVVTVVLHVAGLNLIRARFDVILAGATRSTLSALSLFLMAGTTFTLTLLHGLEATIWAGAFRLLRALPDEKSAILYSLNAMTTFGHSGYVLAGQWHLMGALEALNGWILFGLSTAFLYAINQKVWRLAPELKH